MGPSQENSFRKSPYMITAIKIGTTPLGRKVFCPPEGIPESEKPVRSRSLTRDQPAEIVSFPPLKSYGNLARYCGCHNSLRGAIHRLYPVWHFSDRRWRRESAVVVPLRVWLRPCRRPRASPREATILRTDVVAGPELAKSQFFDPVFWT